MKLVSVYRYKGAVKILYDLLKERPPEACISHKKMPSFAKHKKFVRSVPYKHWFIVLGDESKPFGATYISHLHEIGIAMFPPYRRYEDVVLMYLMAKWPNARFLANVAPQDNAHKKLFKKRGFTPIQITYEFTP